MKILRIIILLSACYKIFAEFSFAVYDPTSVPNNKYGIHILFPEEIENAARLVNSSNGDWGYVTIPIQSVDRNLEKWQKFFDDCKRLHLIPLIRLATFPDGPIWPKPTKYDSLDWANFLNSLSWPTANRYVIVYNEPNRAQEWGDELNPDEYAQELTDTSDALKKRSNDFYILNAGFDAAAPTNETLMNEYQFLNLMAQSKPEIFKKIDGWVSHSYPNPDFSGSPYSNSQMGIRSYQHELTFLQDNFNIYGLKVFITETGWQNGRLSEETIAQYYQIAFEDIWRDSYLVAITPFLLSAGGQFENFAFIMPGEKETEFYKSFLLLKKIAGLPEIEKSKVAGTIIKNNDL